MSVMRADWISIALLVICNAISCSVAVWNLSLVQSFGQMSKLGRT